MIATEALLTTKLYVPQAHPNLVPRVRLSEKLEEGMGRKLTLISAPADFGKTAFSSEWRMMHSGDQYPVSWISLDEDYNDPARFLSYFVAALQTIKSDIGEPALVSLRSPQPPPVESVLTALINKVAAVPNEFALVLDDCHVIEAEPIHDAIAFCAAPSADPDRIREEAGSTLRGLWLAASGDGSQGHASSWLYLPRSNARHKRERAARVRVSS